MSKTKQAKRPLTRSERHTRMVNRLWLLLSLVVALLVLYLLFFGVFHQESCIFMYMVREDVKKKQQYSQMWLAVLAGRFLA